MNMMKKKAFFLPFAGDNNMTFIDRFCQKATATFFSFQSLTSTDHMAPSAAAAVSK